MKATISLVASLVWFSAGAWGTTKVSVLGVTSTQAVVRVTTDKTGNCSYQLSERPDLSIPVNDVNPGLFSGANSDARVTSVFAGNERYFVAGQRRGDQATDGRFYSRALAANTPHYGAVTCGTDAAVAFTFTTHTIPVGGTYMEPLPFDSRALGNYALPNVDYTDLTKWYVDPQTGFKFRLVTGPGHMIEGTDILVGARNSGDSNGNLNPTAVGSNWINAANALVPDSTYATYTAAAQDILTLRVASSCPQGTCFSFGWQNVNGSGNGGQTVNVDAYQVSLTGNGNGSPIQVDVALSWNGATPGTDWFPVTLPAANGAVTYPLTLASGFAAWQSVSHPLVPGVGLQAVEQHGTVNTLGTKVTQTSGAWFPLDSRLMMAGSKITMTGIEYTVASVDSATQVTLTTSAGTQTGVTAYWFNLAVMVRKHAAVAGTLNVDGLILTLGFSESFGNGGSGFQTHCSHLTTTDSSGIVGRFCLFQTHWGHSAIYWVTDSGDSQFIGRGALLSSSLGVAQDEYGFGFYNGQSLFDTADPNSWWTSATLTQSNRATLVKLTYNPNGVAGCTLPAGYQPVTPATNYDPASIDNCNVVPTEITRPSLGKDLFTQINAINPIAVSSKFPQPGLSFVQNGIAMLTVDSQQDAESWIVTVNTVTGAVKGVYSTYMNTPHGGCRGCVLHATVPSAPTDNWFNLAFNNYPGGGNTAQGPYYLTINTAVSAIPSISIAACQSIVTDPGVAWMLPYSDGCDIVTYAGSDGILCDPSPSAWEQANMPACTWTSSAMPAGSRQWQAGVVQIGDWFQDPVSGYESMVVGAKSGNTITLIRNISPPKGPNMVVQPGIAGAYLRDHPAGWTAGVECSFPNTGFVSTAEVNGSGMIWDRKLWGSGHLVMRAAGLVSSELYAFSQGPSGQSVRIGTLPGSANTPETNAVLNGAAFAGVRGAGGAGGYVQAHPGWNDAYKFYTDMAPFAPSQGGSFNLWPNDGTVNVTGTLYKIPAASTANNTGFALNPRLLGTAVWSGMFNFKDVSGTGAITGNVGDNFHYCVIPYAGATCGQSGAGESVGDLFLNIPQASPLMHAGQAYDINSPSVTSLGMEPLAALQYFYYHTGPYPTENMGRWERRVTTAMARYDGQDTYSNSKVIFNSSLLLLNCGTPNLQRIGDLCVGQVPPESQDSITRNDFVRYPVRIPSGGATYAEVQFGYGENGAAGQFFCTTRQEACNTSSPTGTPFNWEAEPRTLLNCATGCTIQVPSLASRVLYYSIRRSADGVSWTNGALQVATVN